MSELSVSVIGVSVHTFAAELWVRKSSCDVTSFQHQHTVQPKSFKSVIFEHQISLITLHSECCSERHPSGNLVDGLPLVKLEEEYR